MLFDYYYPNTRKARFLILSINRQNILMDIQCTNEEIREIIQGCYTSDRATFEEITVVEFATNATDSNNNNSDDDDGQDDNRDEQPSVAMVDKLLGKSVHDDDDDKKLDLSIFKDELGTLFSND